ncbi:MAG: hypothetical protein M1830_008874, partial [Pleopsidium flavum]
MTFFGKPKRKQVSPEASRKRKPINHDNHNKHNISQAQTSLNLVPAPPNIYPTLHYLSPPLPSHCWPPPPPPPPQSPYRYPPAGNPMSQANLLVQPPPPPIYGLYGHDLKGKSCTNLPTALTKPVQRGNDGIGEWQHRTTNCLNRGAALCDLISSKFDTVITLIDGERFSGDERELVIYQNPQPLIRGGGVSATREVAQNANNAISTAITSTNYFAKANLYANARLPPNLPPLKLYMPTYPLLCLAAQFSQRVYTRPSGAERETHVDADWRLGTKAMVIKSVPIDDMSTVVFAIRGSQTFMDWAVNLNSAPTTPSGFLDDPGNLCHSGFLSVARKMVKPVAARLRSMLEEDPSRASCSLLITGHSAGGAVASLLYAHMLAVDVKSELNILTGCFKRVHCITFGAPPISLLPLQKPPTRALRKSLFLSFINEGDPVPRADKAYVRSLLDLYASPSPGSSCLTTFIPSCPVAAKLSTLSSTPTPNPTSSPMTKAGLLSLGLGKKRPSPTRSSSAPTVPAIIWKVPPSTLSNAGRLVLLRSSSSGRAIKEKQKEREGMIMGEED